MTGAVRRHVARWDGWDWAGLVSSTAAVVVLAVCVAVGDSWPGSEVLLVLAVLTGGLGLALLLPRRGPVEDSEDGEVPQ